MPARANASASWPMTITAPVLDAGGQALRRVEERPEVELVGGGQRVQRGAHRAVRGLQDAQLVSPLERSSVEYVRW